MKIAITVAERRRATTLVQSLGDNRASRLLLVTRATLHKAIAGFPLTESVVQCIRSRLAELETTSK